MKGRITITMRHTRRIYVGMDSESFAALYGLVKLGGNAAVLFGRKEDHPARKKVVDAFNSFYSRISEAAKEAA